MRNLFFSISIMLFPLATVQAAVPYQLPGVTICDAKYGCAIEIDSDGFLRDTTSHEKIFDIPFSQTIFDSYLLLKAGPYYVVERSNTTSSRNWDVLQLTYAAGSARAERVISLSRTFSMKPPMVYWGGYECRGGANMEKQYSPFDAAKKALCGGSQQSDSEDLAENAVIDTAKKRGLVVGIPVYGATSKQNAVYFFPGADEPDAGSLLCLQNCKSGSENFGEYGGWISKTFWIDCVLRSSGNSGILNGSYFYIGKKERINLSGSYLNGTLNLRESFPLRNEGPDEHATFSGGGSNDAMTGKWHSIQSGKTYDFFIASRIY